MLTKLSLIFFKVIKAYGVSSMFYDTFISIFNAMEIDLSVLFYFIAIEGIFVFLKSIQIKIPVWVEAIEGLI
jgi:hypothetical protein